MNALRRLTLVLFLAACGGSGTSPDSAVSRLEITPAATLLNAVGASVRFSVEAFDSSGGSTSTQGVSWSSLDTDVATVSSTGLATAVGAGTARIVAEVEGVSATAELEVWILPEVASYEAGTSYFGRGNYVEYIPGTLPVVISAPHGGALTPSEIPDRSYGTTVTDSYTIETIRAVRDAFVDATGHAPHVIISHLRRTKLDPNREIVEAAQGSPYAENAWEEFQGFIELASDHVAEEFGSGLYLDLHGHGHEIRRLELGYLISSSELGLDDTTLNQTAYAASSSIAALASRSPLPFSALLRGGTSFGSYLGDEGVPSVPSPDDPSPAGAPYFSGGYNTARHGSQAGGAIDGIQLELHRPGIRDTDANRRVFGRALAETVERYLTEHYGFFLPGG